MATNTFFRRLTSHSRFLRHYTTSTGMTVLKVPCEWCQRRNSWKRFHLSPHLPKSRWFSDATAPLPLSVHVVLLCFIHRRFHHFSFLKIYATTLSGAIVSIHCAWTSATGESTARIPVLIPIHRQQREPNRTCATGQSTAPPAVLIPICTGECGLNPSAGERPFDST